MQLGCSYQRHERGLCASPAVTEVAQVCAAIHIGRAAPGIHTLHAQQQACAVQLMLAAQEWTPV